MVGRKHLFNASAIIDDVETKKINHRFYQVARNTI